MDIDFLVKLTARAWALPILAQIATGTPARQAPLMAATGAGRGAFQASLEHLVALGLLERNPGHGHPLRPEFRLTPAGRIASETAVRIRAVLPAKGDATLLRLSWSIPILARTATARRFGAIKADLPGITDRALSQGLTRLEAQDWLRRDIDLHSRPPHPLYRAVNLGRAISLAANSHTS